MKSFLKVPMEKGGQDASLDLCSVFEVIRERLILVICRENSSLILKISNCPDMRKGVDMRTLSAEIIFKKKKKSSKLTALALLFII